MPDLIYRAAKPAGNDPAEFVLSDETIDRHGEIVSVTGWDLKNFKRNPIALFNHRSDAVVGRWSNVRVEGKQLKGRLELAPEGTSPDVDKARGLVDGDFIRGVSVGFVSIEKELLDDDADEFWGPFRHLKQELVEASLVAIPANPNALRVGKSFSSIYRLPAGVHAQLFGVPAKGKAGVIPAAFRVPAKPPPSKAPQMKTPISKQIETAQADLTRLRDQLTELVELGDDRDDTQETLFDALPGEIEAAEQKLARLVNAEKAMAGRQAAAGDEDPITLPAVREASTEPAPTRDRPFALPKKKVELYDFYFRAMAAGVKAFTDKVELGHMLRQMYGTDQALEIVTRAAVSPANTTVAGWAAELVQTANAAFLDRLVVESMYARLSALGARYDLGRNGSLKIPTRASTPRAAGAWVGEGAPKPVKRIGLSSVTLTPHKLAVISTYTEEMALYSTPAIEGVLRQAMTDDTSEALDGFLIDNVAASATRPAGLLNGVTPLTPSAAATDTAKIVADLKALVGAIIGAGGGRSIAILMNPLQALSIGFAQTSTGDFMFAGVTEAGQKFMATIIPNRGVPAGTLIAVDAADFATATGDAPRFAVSNEATLHEEDTSPLALGTVGSPNTVAAPMRSLFQTDSIAIRLSLYVTWAMRRAGMVATMSGVTW